jgi:alkylation response protein AidB-like acyl-CoA dehydrogenase
MQVASSDATNIRTSIRQEGDEIVINGHKWFVGLECRHLRHFTCASGTSAVQAIPGQRSISFSARVTPKIPVHTTNRAL